MNRNKIGRKFIFEDNLSSVSQPDAKRSLDINIDAAVHRLMLYVIEKFNKVVCTTAKGCSKCYESEHCPIGINIAY
jgi:predicted aldo/keto reductase-like oxidoreductase